ncbi:hypothetical protein SAMD00019534_086000, partial [Acytostelium subglobosum LB1]|uniref:hypothetical protein n=1 Tax=Acytostelium subglobosum LB1 TaxID=1410327 RepID=UPI00064507BF
MVLIKIKCIKDHNKSHGFEGFRLSYPNGLNAVVMPPTEFIETINRINRECCSRKFRYQYFTLLFFLIAIPLIVIGFFQLLPFLYIIGFSLIVVLIISSVVTQSYYRRMIIRRLHHVLAEVNAPLQPRGIHFHLRDNG